MNPAEASATDVVISLDDVSPLRLGALLLAARKQRSLTRRRVVGLFTGLAVVAGVGCSGSSTRAPPASRPPTEVTTTSSAPVPDNTMPPSIPSSTIAHEVTAQSADAPTTTTTTMLAIGSAMSAQASPTTVAKATTDVKPQTDGTRPVITPDTTPVSILPYGPITIIQK